MYRLVSSHEPAQSNCFCILQYIFYKHEYGAEEWRKVRIREAVAAKSYLDQTLYTMKLAIFDFTVFLKKPEKKVWDIHQFC